MSWSLDVYATRAELISLDALQKHLQASPSPISVASVSPIAGETPAVSAQDSNSQDAQPWRELHIHLENGGSIVGRVLAIPFSAESSADPELVPAFEREIEEADEDTGQHDEEFTSHLRQTLRQVCWHYSVCVRQNGRPEQQHAVVKTVYAISQLGDGLVHDPQTGAWMDAGLFESLLDAYGVEDLG